MTNQGVHHATQAAAPLRTGLSAARVVVWAAALALCAARARAGCFAAAAALVAAAQRLSSSSGAQRAAALARQVTKGLGFVSRCGRERTVLLRVLCTALACSCTPRQQMSTAVVWHTAVEAAVTAGERGSSDRCSLAAWSGGTAALSGQRTRFPCCGVNIRLALIDCAVPIPISGNERDSSRHPKDDHASAETAGNGQNSRRGGRRPLCHTGEAVRLSGRCRAGGARSAQRTGSWKRCGGAAAHERGAGGRGCGGGSRGGF
jgi:hypothetical protein